MYGLLAEYDSPSALMQAAEKLRDAGYTKFDCHSPFPIHGMDQAMGMKGSPVGFIAGICAFVGGSSALLLQWWSSVEAYPLVISGKPFFSYQAFVPVTFGLTILFAALGAVFGMLILNRLPQLYHSLFNSARFEKVTRDGFFVSVEATDPKFEAERTRQLLAAAGSSHIETVES